MLLIDFPCPIVNLKGIFHFVGNTKCICQKSSTYAYWSEHVKRFKINTVASLGGGGVRVGGEGGVGPPRVTAV